MNFLSQKGMFALISAASLVACARPPELHSETSRKQDAVIFARTECLGTCPAYQVIVFDDDTFVYHGRQNVRVKAIVTGRLSGGSYRLIAKAIDQVDLRQLSSLPLQERCPGGWATDNPGAVIEIQRNGDLQGFFHDYGCAGLPHERELGQIEDQIDKVVGTSRWVD